MEAKPLSDTRRKLTSLGRSTLVTETDTNLSIPVFVAVLKGEITLEQTHDMLKERLLRQHSRFRSLVEGEDTWIELSLDDVNLEDHVTVHEMADPKNAAELHGLLGYYSGRPLSKTKPLWDCILIPKYMDGSALIFRQHHCLADGMAGAVIIDSMSDSPMQFEPQPVLPLSQRILQFLLTILVVIMGMPFVIYLTIKNQCTGDKASPIKPAELKGGRRKVGISEMFDVADLKKLCRASGVTINDLGLSLITLALRDQQTKVAPEVPTKPIWCAIPINTRGLGEVYIGNKFGFAVCQLPLNLSKPTEVFKYVRNQMLQVKKHNAALIMYYLSSFLSWATPTCILRPMLANTCSGLSLVVSNVQSGGKALSFKGHLCEAFYGLVPPPPTVGLGFAILSYQDKLVFTVAADSAVQVDPAQIVEYIGQSVRELQASQQK